jgi:DNA-directed RNA polymerase specialized sigma24 family protein
VERDSEFTELSARAGTAWSALPDCSAARPRQSRHRRGLGELPTEYLPDVTSPDGAPQSDSAVAIRRALDRLPQAQREAVVLRYY